MKSEAQLKLEQAQLLHFDKYYELDKHDWKGSREEYFEKVLKIPTDFGKQTEDKKEEPEVEVEVQKMTEELRQYEDEYLASGGTKSFSEWKNLGREN